ncbi:conserved hypothetical protein [Verticillium alfalfae VaMs.102]|uniref:lytic cellulose monooxygenase (C4-dehydrogenating) n=1 Tax=Verticillium alfalfae (strain VaMs.102 / ATCC MYA-4576 / FGSC 10136) TaxID=526221 RepID=C9SAF5_VERA1|nr:conserved hypothetical protein [Verticillium alfalfae VaMs.102]EEY16323.1 conserved hypothetical protein [Verticillium alfalfae VaMs.102]
MVKLTKALEVLGLATLAAGHGYVDTASIGGVEYKTIALHAAFAYPGVQFYPNCHQLEITGLGTVVPTDLVSFPGAYAADDPGVTFNAYLPRMKRSDDAARVAETGSEIGGPASKSSSCIDVACTREPVTRLKVQMMRVIDVMAAPKVLVANEAHVGTDSTAPLEKQCSAIHSRRGPIKIMR